LAFAKQPVFGIRKFNRQTFEFENLKFEIAFEQYSSMCSNSAAVLSSAALALALRPACKHVGG
jgi:hypothetical protein